MDLFLEPKPGIPPSPAQLASVLETMKREHIKVIIIEPYQSKHMAATVAQQTGATVLDFAQYPGGVKGTEGDYLALLDKLVSSLAAALATK